MLKTQHPTDYLKKEEINSEVAKQAEEKQHIEQIKAFPKLKRYRRSDTHPSSSDTGQQGLSLPENFEVKSAIGGGDCFFDSVAKGLKQLKPEMDFTVKSLRETCKRFAQSQLGSDQSWLKEALRNENEQINEYIPRIEFAAVDITQRPEPVLLGLNEPIWGRTEIEGRIICKEYNVKLHVIEKHSVQEEEIWTNQIVDELGARSVDDIDYNEANTIHIVNKGDLHFEPILDKTRTRSIVQEESKLSLSDERQSNSGSQPIDPSQHRQINPRSSDSTDYEDEVTPEEELISTVKSSDSEEEKLRKIRGFFVKELKPNINFQGKDNDTPLHIAVRRKELKVIELLVKNGADINIKNDRGRSPLDIAERLNRQDIARIMQSTYQQRNAGGRSEVGESRIPRPDRQLSRSTAQGTNDESIINERLKVFVDGFVNEFETKIKSYYDEVIGKTKKSSKSSSTFEAVGTGLGAAAGTLVGAPGPVGTAGGKAGSFLGSFVGERGHKSRARRITEVFDISQDEKPKLRKILVDAGVDIFRNFENQFMRVVINGGWRVAMRELAQDATERVMNYVDDYKEKNPETVVEISHNLIAKSFILGKSKGYVGTLIPKRTVNNQQQEWKIAGLCEKVGLVTIKSDGTADKYYKKKDGKSNTSKYGYRHLFKWELEDRLELARKLNAEYQEEKPPREEYKYILKPENIKEKSEYILNEINKKDPTLKFDRIEEGVDNVREEMREGFQDDKKEHKKTQKRVESVKQGINDLQKGQEVIIKILDKKDQDKRPVWFDIREPVTSFTALSPGRQDTLNQVASSIQKGIVVISGLGGVGKSELAIKCARSQYSQEDSVILINAETSETVKESFHRLLKEKLKISIKDIDGEEKSIKSIIEDVYEYFSDRRSLFIFDNAEKYTAIEKFLPLDLPNNAKRPYVLVTSPNSLEWKSTRINIETLSLSDFTDTEAMEFIKKSLEIDNGLQSEDIRNLAKKLYNFPLALQHAVTYIKDTNEELKERGSEFKVSNYLEKYEQAPRRLLSLELPYDAHIETTSKTLKITIDKIKDNKEYGQQALDMLNIMSYFMSRNIPEEFFFNELANGNQEKLMSITRLLKKYSIVGLGQGMLSVHGLIQQVIRLELESQQEEGESLEEKTLEQALNLLKDHMKDFNSVERYVPHMISIWNHASKYDRLIEAFIVDDVINDTKNRSIKCFHLIAGSSNYEVVNTILSKIEDSNNLRKVINARDENKKTPLHYAAQGGNEEIVKLLISKGANVDTYDRIGNRPLHIATKNGHLKIIEALLDKNSEIINAKTSPKYEFTPLHLAAQNGYPDVVTTLLRRGADINAETKYKYTPLHLAAEKGHLGVVQALLEDNQVSVNAETEYKLTPLHLAAEKGHVTVVDALLSKGAGINAQDTGRLTPLHLAAFNGRLDVVEFLVGKGANVNAQTKKGNTPLHLAAENGNLEIVKALIAKNPDIIDIENEEGNKAFDLAVKRDNLEISNYIRQQTFNRRQGTSGISGQLYEIQLLMLFLLKGPEKTNGFHLATNVKEAGDFDDVVFKYKDQNGVEKTRIIFLQAKHKDNTDKDKITIGKLFSESEKGDFNLKKYFNSYRKIKQRFSEEKVDTMFGSKFEDSDFIIYTNALPNFGKSDKSVEKITVGQDDILNLEENRHYYKLSLDEEVKKKRIDTLKYASDCKKLAKELVDSIFSDKELDMNEGILRDYHIPLADKVIEKKEGKGKFRDSLLSSEDNIFRNTLFEEVWKRGEFTKKSENELKSELKSISIELPKNFGGMNAKKGKYPESLPNDLVSENEIEEFLSKLKLFVDQPNENKLSEIVKNKIKEVYGVAEQDIDSVFSDIEYKVRKWWQAGDKYLTEDNRLFQDAARVSIWFDVKKTVDLFTGRRQKLSDLHKRMQRSSKSEKVTIISQMTSISGLGGIGKTELARQYIQEHSKNHYDNNVIWVNAEREATLIESFYRLAKDKLRISTKDADGKEKYIKSIVEEVYKFFAKRKSLFIFDNAEKDEGFKKFLPLSALNSNDNKPYVLITSRVNKEEWKQWGIEGIELDVFTEPEAISFVKTALKIEGMNRSQDDKIKELVDILHRFPLALQQAVAHIKEENEKSKRRGTGEYTIDKYLGDYKEKTKELLNSEAFKSLDNDYAKTTFATWKITTDKIKGDEKHGQLALEILDMMAYFAANDIPIESSFSKLVESEEKLWGAVELLNRYSMIKLEQGKSDIHRLVQEVTRLELKGQSKEEEILGKVFDLLKESFPYGKDTLEGYAKKRQLLPHLEVFSSHIDDLVAKEEKPEDKQKIEKDYLEDLLTWMGSGYSDLGNPKREKELLERALAIQEKNYGPDHFQVAITLVSLGNAYGALGDHQKKKELLERALAIKEKHYNLDHFEVANTLNSLGNAYGAFGNHQKKKELLERALAIKETHYGLEHFEVAGTLNGLGNAYGALGDHQKKKELLERALAIKETHYGLEHFEVAGTLNNLSNAYGALGDPQKQRELLERALPILEKHYGPDHFQVAHTLNNLGNAYFALGNPQKQKELLEQALLILEEHYGPEHFEVARTLGNLGTAYGDLGNPQKQKELLERALAIQEKHYGPEHFEVARTLNNLGLAYRHLGNPQKQKELLERALPILEKKNSPLEIAGALNNLGIAYGDLGDHQKQKELLERALAIKETHYGLDHFQAASTLNSLGTAYGALGDHQKQKELLGRALAIREKHYGLEHFEVANTLNKLSTAYEALGDHQKQKELLERALAIQEKHYGLEHSYTLQTKNKIAEVLSNPNIQDKEGKTPFSVTDKIESQQEKVSSSVQSEQCPPSSGSSGRRKREAKECELSWDDVDEFNEEKENVRDFSRIKINSNKFIDYIKSESMSETKLAQLLHLADKSQVTGKFQGLVNNLISNQKVMDHLSRVGRVSGIAMHGMMAKNVLAAFLNGDGEGVAINLGFIAGGQGFARVAQAASVKGAGLVLDGKLMLGRSLKAASPFLARGTSAFVMYDLVNQIKAFKNGTEEALVGVIGDSIYLGVDAAEVGIEIAEAFEIFEGVSSITGPIGAAIGAVVFVGTDVYLAVKRVNKIDEIIHLTTKERFIEGLRAFIGMNLEGYIEELMEEKQVNNQLVTQGLEYLKQHDNIQRYIFPTGKSVIDSCRTVQYREQCLPTGLRTCYEDELGNLFTIKKREKCTTKLQVDLDNKILLDSKRTDIKWSRGRPSDSGAGEFLCLPQGNYESVPSNGTYLCENAIGVEYANNRTGSNTLISLGNGDDVVMGFSEDNHIVVLGNGHKNITLGDGNDTFLLEGNNITGVIYGGNGTNTLDLEHFAQEEKSVQISLSKTFGYVYHKKDNNVSYLLEMHGINNVLLRRDKQDYVYTTCNTRYVDGRSGESNNDMDNVAIPYNSNCFYEIRIIVRPYTNIENYAINGNFTYIVPIASKGEASVNLIAHTNPQSNHRFVFSHTLYDINNIEKINNTVSFSFIQNVGNIRFAPKSVNTRYTTDYEFNITNNAANSALYELNDNTEIKVGERNIYAIQSTNRSVDEIISDYPTIANNLKMSIFVQSLSSNETVAVGHGNHDVLHNDPYYKSHLVGNGGENIFVVTSGYEVLDNNDLPIPEVVIYDLDKENLIDTLDLRQMKQQIVKDLGKEVKAKTLINNKDLLIELLCFRENQVEESVVRVRLKDALLTNWYERLHVIVGNVPMKIEEFELKPLPLIFDQSDKNIIVIGSQDIEEENKVVVSKEIGNYTFARSGNNLIITNAFDRNLTSNEFCTISLKGFYQETKMQTLDIKFADKEIILKDHQEQISSARDIDVVKKEHKDQVYDDVFNHTRSESSEVNETTIHEIRHRDEYLNVTEHQRSRRAINEKEIPITSSKVSANDDLEFFVAQNNATFVMENDRASSAATRIGSGINDLFDWVKSSIGGLFHSRAALPENNTTQSSISQVDAQVNVNGTIMLLDVFIRKITGQNHIPSVDKPMSLLEAQANALNITEQFDMLLKRTARSCGIQDNNSNFNPIEVQSTIVEQLINGNFSKILKTLYSSAEKAYPEFKQTDKFLAHLKNNLKDFLDEKEVELLAGKQKGLSKGISNNKLVKKSVPQVKEDNKPNTFLNDTLISKQLSYVERVRGESSWLKSGVRIG